MPQESEFQMPTIIEGLRILRSVPIPGHRFLSVNLGKVPLNSAIAAATALGFMGELVQMPTPSGIQVHLLLWEGAIEDTPTDLEDKFDQLSEQIDPDAIRYATGRWTHQEHAC